MKRNEYLLSLLGEEAVEIAHRVNKALRFTLHEVQPGQEQTNAQRLSGELDDLVATLEILEEQGIFSHVRDRAAIEAKKDRIVKFLIYSKQLGVIDDPL